VKEKKTKCTYIQGEGVKRQQNSNKIEK